MAEYEFIEIFGDNLRDALRDANISQNELSRRTGIVKQTISSYMNKKSMPSLRNVINISIVLGCEISDLVPVYEKII